MTVDAVEVANAALADVGLPPLARSPHGDDICVPWEYIGNSLVHRAQALGAMADPRFGPTQVVRCLSCWSSTPQRPACTTVADVLRGVTCGRQS